VRVILRDVKAEMQGMVNRYQANPVALAESRSHCHDELELNLVLRGTGSYLLLGRRYDLSHGCMLWLFPRQEHLLIAHSSDFMMWVVAFTPELVRQQAEAMHLPQLCADDPPGYHCRILEHRSQEELHRLCIALIDEDIPVRARRSGLAWLLVQAWTIFQRSLSIEEMPHIDPIIEHAAQLLQDPHQQWPLPALARELKRSPAWVSRRFHAELGMTMSDFRNRQRLLRFFDLFNRKSTKNLLQIALSAGFTSYPQFSRIFRASMGKGPRRYFASKNE
jgi:AraC-like DNA-binding protein